MRKSITSGNIKDKKNRRKPRTVCFHKVYYMKFYTCANDEFVNV